MSAPDLSRLYEEPAQKRRCDCTQKLQTASERERGTCNDCERARREEEAAQWDAAHDAATVTGDALAATFSAEWLMRQSFPAVAYVVPGMISEGLTLLVGAPKVGKSWMVLAVASAVARGSHALGSIRLDSPRPVLYMALEDGPRRLQNRMRTLEEEGSTGLHFATSVHRDDVLNVVSAFIDRHRDERPVVLLDTLGKVMPPALPGENDYQRDYRVGSALKATMDNVPGSAVIVVHHTNKAVHDDFLNAVSGTQGLAGAADTIVLLRRERTKATGVLSVTSRDAAEGEYQVVLNGMRWELDGGNLAEARAALAETRATSNLGERSAAVLRFVNENPAGVTPADVNEALGIEDANLQLKRHYDAGRIARPARGVYTPATSDTSATFDDTTATADPSEVALIAEVAPTPHGEVCAVAGCDEPAAQNNYGTCLSMALDHVNARADIAAEEVRP